MTTRNEVAIEREKGKKRLWESGEEALSACVGAREPWISRIVIPACRAILRRALTSTSAKDDVERLYGFDEKLPGRVRRGSDSLYSVCLGRHIR